MSKKVVLLSGLFVLALLYSCGPAAENRQMMHERAKSFQDSIAGVIRATLAEAEGTPAAAPQQPAPDSPATAPTPTTK